MTILSESTQWGAYYGEVILAGTLAVLTLLFVILSAYIAQSRKDTIAAFIAILFVSAPIVLTIMSVNAYKEGPSVEVKAVVADWNEVYANNYEVIGREGEIYTLKEARP